MTFRTNSKKVCHELHEFSRIIFLNFIRAIRVSAWQNSFMQTEMLEKTTVEITPVNEVAELIDREIHARTLEQVNVLAREYEIRNPSEVARFLRDNTFLLGLLEEIPKQIRKVFGKRQELALEFFWNPEDPTWHQIHVLVPTHLSVDETFSAMEKFEENWWLENFARADMKLQILEERAK